VKISLKIDTSELDKMEKAINSIVKDTILTMAKAQLSQIRERVGSGVGVKDQKMPAYSAKTKIARRKKGLSTGIRSLKDTGAMLDSMKITELKKTTQAWIADLGFSNRGEAEKAKHHQQLSPWFGVSPKDEESLGALAEKRMSQLAKQKGLS
jgi:site-specific DNA-cytosine methylase